MKKLFSIILTLSLVTTLMLTLAACGGEIEPDLYDLTRAAIGDEEVIPLDPPPEPTDDPEIPIEEPEITEELDEPVEASIEVGNIIPFGDYDWRVLDVQDGRALIITENIIEKRPFNDDDNHKGGTLIMWSDSELRSYLNNEFYSSFNANDREKIIVTINQNPDNPWIVSGEDADTEDYIFLLSLEEVMQYFGGDIGLLYDNRLDEPIPFEEEGFPTRWWWIDDERQGTSRIIDEYNSARIAYDDNGEAQAWWLRTPARFSGAGAGIWPEGYIDVIGWYVARLTPYGVRPAMWISVES
jgi:hypothetical protein